MKRSIAVMLSALLLLTSVPMVSADAFNDDQFEWGDDACPHTRTETVEAVASTCITQGHGAYTYCVACKLLLDGSRDLLPLADHAYEVETTPADCMSDGLSLYTCTVCGHSYEEIIPANDEHVYVYSCDQYCNNCGEKTNPRAKHNVLHVEAKAAVSCIELGNREYWRCDSCGTVWLDATLMRQSNMKSVMIAGACVSDSPACKDGVCIHCGLPCAAETEHTYDNACDTDCNGCGAVRETAHDYQDTEILPDCENSGYVIHTCTVCGDSYVDGRVDALGHDYVPLSAEPATCNKDGFEKYYCPNCGDSYTEIVPATNKHTYDPYYYGDPHGCDEDCNVCGYIRDDAHNYIHMGTDEPTCGTDGKHYYACLVCGKTKIDSIPSTGNHTYSGVCDAACNVCGLIRASVEPHNYILTDEVEVTCETDGMRTYTCFGCGDSYTETETASGHKYHIVVTAPDCENGGYTTHTCSVCGYSCVDNRVPALGHSYDDDSDPNCNVCGAEREVTVRGDLSGDGKVNNRDLGLLQKHLNGTTVTIDELAADMDGNGKINNRDLGLLQRYLNS